MSGLRDAFDEIVADVPVYGDLDRAIKQAEQERHRRLGAVAGLAAAAAVVALIAGAVAITSGDNAGTPAPTGPSTPTESTSETAEWDGPIRPGTLPVVSDKQFGPDGNPWRGWTDPRDSAVGQIDIRLVAGWGLQLREDKQLEAWMNQAGRIVEYGIVVDKDGDGVADCQVALNNDTPPGRGFNTYRMALRNLRTGKADERIKGGYGFPFEFGFPADDYDIAAPSVYIEFLGEWQRPCAAPEGRIRWYAYASLTENGRVIAWDFAPDEAWLQTLPGLDVGLGGRIGQLEWGRGLPLPMEP